jgi:predicted dinucleotide-binding enzyme
MRIAMLGTGGVGRTLGTKLVALGHEVRMGSRTADGVNATAWVESAGERASEGTFEDAAAFGELAFNATAGARSLEALAAAGADNLAGKVVVDVANPLDFSAGMPPTLAIANDDSLGERIQRDFPDTRVVKTLNTVNAEVMADPGLVPGDHTMFLAGDDVAAKAQVAELLEAFGWPRANLMDLGDIGAARGMEMYLPLWLRLYSTAGTPHLNVHVVTEAG